MHFFVFFSYIMNWSLINLYCIPNFLHCILSKANLNSGNPYPPARSWRFYGSLLSFQGERADPSHLQILGTMQFTSQKTRFRYFTREGSLWFKSIRTRENIIGKRTLWYSEINFFVKTFYIVTIIIHQEALLLARSWPEKTLFPGGKALGIGFCSLGTKWKMTQQEGLSRRALHAGTWAHLETPSATFTTFLSIKQCKIATKITVNNPIPESLSSFQVHLSFHCFFGHLQCLLLPKSTNRTSWVILVDFRCHTLQALSMKNVAAN